MRLSYDGALGGEGTDDYAHNCSAAGNITSGSSTGRSPGLPANDEGRECRTHVSNQVLAVVSSNTGAVSSKVGLEG